MSAGPLSGAKEKMSGRVMGISRFNRKFRIIEIFSEGGLHRVVMKELDREIKKGSYVSFLGYWRPFKGKNEFCATSVHITNNEVGKRAKHAQIEKYCNLKKLEALEIRMNAEEAIHQFMLSRGFRTVQSPTIVSPWVEGRTTPFAVDYYGKRCYLSICNMIYHHIMMTHGYSRIYEIGKLHRQEKPSTSSKLAEYTIIELGMANEGFGEIMAILEGLIESVFARLHSMELRHHRFPKAPRFERITFSELLRRSELESISGSQLTSLVAKYLGEHYESFVWVTGFPESTRPFYTKSADGVCSDAQLWYQGRRYLAAGGDVDPSVDAMIAKMERTEKRKENFGFYFDHMKLGYPDLCGISIGLELLLGTWIDDARAADFTWFPRYEKAPIG